MKNFKSYQNYQIIKQKYLDSKYLIGGEKKKPCIKISGFKDCNFFKKAKEIVISSELSNYITYKINEFEKKEDYFADLETEKKKLNINHSTSPIVFVDDKFLGGCDNLTTYINDKNYIH